MRTNFERKPRRKPFEGTCNVVDKESIGTNQGPSNARNW